jgi:transcription initiation factor TFIIF subunit beta
MAQVKEEPVDDTVLYGEISVRNANTPVWLVKVPEFLAEHWRNLPDNAVIGKIYLEANEHSQQTQKIPVTITTDPNLPRDYTLVLSQPQQQFQIFSEANDGQLEMVGKVQYRGELNPVSQDNQQYRTVLQKRNTTAIKKDRSVRIEESRMADFSVGMVFKNPAAKQKVVNERGISERRERMDKSKLTEYIFKYFERKDYWHIDDLNQYVQQPVTYLKEVLNELCIRHTSGPYKGMYELKPELRTTSKRPEIPSNSEPSNNINVPKK